MIQPSSFNRPNAPIGFYGKLPAHGDFVSRGLGPKQITVLDGWLQSAVASAQSELGEAWLERYLQTPAWRFVFSSGVIDAFAWAGLLLPSVDRVGRYFPIMALVNLPPSTCLSEFLCMQQTWFAGLEDRLRSALHGRVQIDGIVDSIDELETTELPLFTDKFATAHKTGISSKKLLSQPLTATGDMHHAMAVLALLDRSLSHDGSGYSLWSTSGSDTTPPSVNAATGLPQGKESLALITGDWQSAGWAEGFGVRPSVSA